jgi:endonuclease/exonuclease/phosphatase (EEP) superfamily protein YafD
VLSISFLRIDHILVSPEIGVVSAFAGGKDGSEHRPVIADLLLARDAAR